MDPIKEYIKEKVTRNAEDDVTSEELCVEKTYPAVEDNNVSTTNENIVKFIKTEIDVFNDYKWESTIEIPLENQDITDNTILNYENAVKKIFHCSKCEKSYPFKRLLIKHLKEHKQRKNKKQKKMFRCPICGKLLRLRFFLNRHMQAHSEINFSVSNYIKQ